jgi:hypothetical protein
VQNRPFIHRVGDSYSPLDSQVTPMAGPSTATVALDAGVSLQTLDPTAVLEAPPELRAGGVFLTILLLGGALLWWDERFVGRSIDSSRDRPLVSAAYGVAAHVVILFAAFYLAARLSQFQLLGRNTSVVGLVFGIVVVLLVAALGFTVVGATIVELSWERNPWTGLVVGAGLAGGIAVATTTLAGGVWVAVVSLGIGGAVRRWLQASIVSEAQRA